MLPYAPFSIGLVVSLLELFLVPRREGQRPQKSFMPRVMRLVTRAL